MDTSRGSSSLPDTFVRWTRWTEPTLALVRRAPDLVALIVMAVLGVGISVYLTTVHYTKLPLVCNTTGIIDCAAVTSSKYSLVPLTQIPITIPGLLWFVVSGGLAVVALVALLRGQAEPERLRLATAVWGGLGLVFVLYLVFAEIVLLHKICEWCTVVHLLTLVTFLIALNRLQRAVTGADEEALPATSAAASRRELAVREGAHGPAPRSASRIRPAAHTAQRVARSAGAHGAHGHTSTKSRRR